MNYIPAIYYTSYPTFQHSFYKNYLSTFVLTKSKQSEYGKSGALPIIQESYKCYNKYGQLKTDSTSIVTNGLKRTKTFKYEYEWERNPTFKEMFYMQFVCRTSIWNNSRLSNQKQIDYSLYNQRLPFISGITETLNNATKTTYCCFEVNEKGKPIIEYFSDNIPVVSLWDNYSNYPIVKIKGIDASFLSHFFKFKLSQASKYTLTLSERLALLRKAFPICEIEEYGFTPINQLKYEVAPTGLKKEFNYDTSSRISDIIESNNINIAKFSYSNGSSISIGNDSIEIRKFLDKNIEIYGSPIVYPGSKRYFWSNIADLGFTYHWSLNDSTKSINKSHVGKYVILEGNDSIPANSQLVLNVLNENGNIIWNKSFPFEKRNHVFSLTLEKRIVADNEICVYVSIEALNPDVDINHLTILINGEAIHYIHKPRDGSLTKTSSSFYILRDSNNDLYQISIMTETHQDSWVLSEQDLFSSQLDVLKP